MVRHGGNSGFWILSEWYQKELSARCVWSDLLAYLRYDGIWYLVGTVLSRHVKTTPVEWFFVNHYWWVWFTQKPIMWSERGMGFTVVKQWSSILCKLYIKPYVGNASDFVFFWNCILTLCLTKKRWRFFHWDFFWKVRLGQNLPKIWTYLAPFEFEQKNHRHLKKFRIPDRELF